MKRQWQAMLDILFGPEAKEEGVVWEIDLRPRTRLDDWEDGYWRLIQRLGREPSNQELLEEMVR